MSRKLPVMRLHKASGQWVLSTGGRLNYLGKDQAEAAERGTRILADWIGQGRPSRRCRGATVAELGQAFKEHEYSRFGASERRYFDLVLDRLKVFCGRQPAAAFGPATMRGMQTAMADAGLARGYIGGTTRRIRSLFRWAVATDQVEPSVLTKLTAAPSFSGGGPGRSRVTPRLEEVETVLEVLPEGWKAPVEIQWRGGMRVGELLQLRPRLIEIEGKLWIYRPTSHKSAHRGRERNVLLGPRSQALLRPLLPKDEGRLVFTFTARTYNRALAKACAQAGVERFSSHALRRSWGTLIRKRFGLDHARAALGHSSPTVTAEFYADLDIGVGREAALQLG